jgi:hypothetical protein
MNDTEQKIFNALLKVKKVAAENGIIVKEVGVMNFLTSKNQLEITPNKILGIKIC